jgi:hypothetical protein
MKCVVYDLDLTLAFPVFLPLEQLFGYANRFTGLEIDDPSLERALAQAEENFLKEVLTNKPVMRAFLRPNLYNYLYPVWAAKRAGIVDRVCIYSNTWSPFCVNFTKKVIERALSLPGLFDEAVDATDPIRDRDWKEKRFPRGLKAGAPVPTQYKTMHTIYRLIHETDANFNEILFVDDLVHPYVTCPYYRATPFYPKLTSQIVASIINMAIAALEKEGLLTFFKHAFNHNIEASREQMEAVREPKYRKSIRYILSGVFDTDIIVPDEKIHWIPVKSIADLFKFIRVSYKKMMEESAPRANADPKSDTNPYLNMLFPFLMKGVSEKRVQRYLHYLKTYFKPM